MKQNLTSGARTAQASEPGSTSEGKKRSNNFHHSLHLNNAAVTFVQHIISSA